MELRAVPLHQSLIRPTLVLGADRDLIFALYMLVAIFLLALPWTWITVCMSALIAGIGHPALILLCKFDPDWRRVVIRHLRYQPVYLAGRHPLAERPRTVPAVPQVQEVR